MNVPQPPSPSLKSEVSLPMKPKDFRVKKADHLGRRVDQIYSVDDRYVIYLAANCVSCFIDDEHLPREERELYQRFVQLAPDLSRLYALQPGRLWQKESINRQIARSFNQALEGNLAAARSIIAQVEPRLLSIRQIEGRLQYQFTCLTIVIIFAGILLGIGGLYPNKEKLLLVMGSGAIGGFLSVSLGLSKIRIESEATWLANAMAAVSRLTIATIASVFLYYALRAKIVLGNLDSESFAVLVTTSMLAGFSETLVPNVLRGLNNAVDLPTRGSTEHSVAAVAASAAGQPGGSQPTSRAQSSACSRGGDS